MPGAQRVRSRAAEIDHSIGRASVGAGRSLNPTQSFIHRILTDTLVTAVLRSISSYSLDSNLNNNRTYEPNERSEKDEMSLFQGRVARSALYGTSANSALY